MEKKLTDAFQLLLKELYLRGEPMDETDIPPEIRELLGSARQILSGEGHEATEMPSLIPSRLPDKLHGTAEGRWRALESWDRGDFAQARQDLLAAIDCCPATSPKGWGTGDLRSDLAHCLVDLHNSGDRSVAPEIRDLDMNDLRVRTEDRTFSDTLGGILRRTLMSLVEQRQRSPHTVTFGSPLLPALERCAEALQLAVEHASISMVSAVRADLALALHQFGVYHGDPDLVVSAIELYILERDSKRAKGILDTEWQLLFGTLSRSPLRFLRLLHRRQSSLDLAVQCSILERLGPYVQNEDCEALEKLLFRAFDFDSEKRFSAVSMRASLTALPASMGLLDRSEVLSRVIPLLDEHPVVAQEALRVMYKVRWDGIEKDLAAKAVTSLRRLIGKPMSGAGPFPALLGIRSALPDLTGDLEHELMRDWSEGRNERALVYFAQSHEELELERRIDFGNTILAHIEDENETQDAKRLRFGGLSKWDLLSSFLLPIEPEFLLKVLDTATKVMLNPNQAGHRKAECTDVVLWVYDNAPDSRDDILDCFVHPVLDQSDQASYVKGGSELLGYPSERIHLKLDQLRILSDNPPIPEIVRNCIQYGLDSSVDNRAETVRVLGRLVAADTSHENLSLPCLLLSRTYDKWEWIAGDSIVELARWASGDLAWERILLERLSNLLEHASTYVRSCAIVAAAEVARSDPKREPFLLIAKRGLTDPHDHVRQAAQRQLENL